MAWRIADQIERGEIDSRKRGRVTGQLWLVGRSEPVKLDLRGEPWRDLAGYLLRFRNPNPQPGDLAGFVSPQEGRVGDITASRKVKVPEVSHEEIRRLAEAGKDYPWHLANSLYIEWYSMSNGRVVIESAHYEVSLEGEPAWVMDEGEELTLREANDEAMVDFLRRLERIEPADENADDDEEDDGPTTVAEAEADDEDQRMELLLDRVDARMSRGEEDFDRIYEEERSRLMRERGEEEPEPTPEQIAEQQRWIEEMNAICEQAMIDAEAEAWKDDGKIAEPKRHPLVEESIEFAVELRHDINAMGWLPENAHHEHPLREISDSVMSASVKLGGALGMVDEDEWPPDPLIAGNVLVRLKKARGYLLDALRAFDSAEEENLADATWRRRAKFRTIELLAGTRRLIREAREILEEHEDGF